MDWRLDGVSIYVDNIPNTTEFSNLFDQFRIKSVSLSVDTPAFFSNSGTSPAALPQIWYAADYDDTAMASLTDLMQYPQVRKHNFYTDGYKPLIFKFSPKPLRDVAGAGVTTVYGPMPVSPWLRTSNMTVPHYGIKLALDWFGLSQTQDIPLQFTVWYDLEFTNPK